MITSLVSLGDQAKTKPISHATYDKETEEKLRVSMYFCVICCPMTHTWWGKGRETAGPVPSSVCRLFVHFTQQLDLLTPPHTIHNDFKPNYLFYRCALSFIRRTRSFSGTAASTSQLIHFMATIFFHRVTDICRHHSFFF